MYSCKLGSLALLLALSASHHFILLHCLNPWLDPEYGVPPTPPLLEYEEQPTPFPLESAPAKTRIAPIAGAVSSLVAVMVVLFASLIFIRRKRRTRQSAQPVRLPQPPQDNQVPLVPLPSSMDFQHSPIAFTYGELDRATEGFSESNFLGQGGFGPVYKGILSNKKTVAIKQQKSGSKQGEQEFRTEVDVISRVRHRHLVSLVGYCIAEAQMTLMLVYEFVPNKTLDFHLHGKGTETLDWSTRMKIANGSAKGLAYLHEDCEHKIIHRDIKAANILLDNNFDPKIADFGLAKLSSDTDTHVSGSKIKGTFGYLAPEYANSGILSEKADVFSFGVVLLELIAGRKPVLRIGSDDSLVEWARPLLFEALDKRNFEVLADPRLQNNYNSGEMFRMASCAANCVRRSRDDRPRMSQVVDALRGNINLDNQNEESTQVDNQDLSKFWKQALGEYNEPTSSSLENTT